MKLFRPTKSEKYKHHLNPLLQLFASNYNDFGSSGQHIKEIQSLPQIPFHVKNRKKCCMKLSNNQAIIHISGKSFEQSFNTEQEQIEVRTS